MAEVIEYLKYGPLAALALIENKNPAVRQFGHGGTPAGDARQIMRWPEIKERVSFDPQSVVKATPEP